MPETPVPLYRQGNANSPRMDNVRDRDVDIYDYSGEKWVETFSNGISTFESPKLGRNWWRIDAGIQIPDSIILINDKNDHWGWRPAYTMRLLEYQELLKQVSIHFVRFN
ncbi:hypothetical protein [Planktothrix agardhii]|jgi:hypothetical protein|uniref:Tse2 ADP-ribosyltransferase toxin domain-containing protein n=4 Tax=Planktothrix agardhii TaxID=1160 RepID=A0A1U9WVV4_PLAA1|nr:hypothetical protein [Planktothrix agardhii]AQY60397.1 hypothetical protein [Planktothrix agardhii NIVA-CYA 126/8]AQY60572.1 hypothetical protein [Planktothrix agardhii No66]MCF3597049.1 hypothetical protein [Planktothrix agardhii 1032]MCB8758433.1 hypothetical protein [Planktothrix agardhii 1813]CAD5914926.1 hypothetical protein PANO66_00299 [Planktothrix agardhii]